MSIRITLVSALYPSGCVEAAVSAFSHLCAIRLFANPTSITADMSTEDEESKVVNEFLNYLLMLSLEQQFAQTGNDSK